MDTDLITLTGVTKYYGKQCILNNQDFKIQKGQSIAVIGANGTGKSTFLKILMGLIRVESGKIIHSPNIDISYVPEQFYKMNLTVLEYLNFMREIKNGKNIVEELIDEFYMSSMKDTIIKNLSKGSLQKIVVIQAILTEPSVLFMDEPLSGQDVKSQRKFISLIKAMNKNGTAIIMSCHEKYLIRELAEEIYEIQNGSLIKINKESITFKVFDILYFEKNEKKHEFAYPCEILEEDENILKIKIISDNSNLFIEDMIKKGFILREMYNEYL